MGDAAFVARPHVGMGVTKAAEDAMALTDCIEIHGANSKGLLAFEALRLLPGQQVVERARRLGAFMQAHVESGLAAGAVVRDAHQVMMETAVDLSMNTARPVNVTSATAQA